MNIIKAWESHNAKYRIELIKEVDGTFTTIQYFQGNLDRRLHGAETLESALKGISEAIENYRAVGTILKEVTP